MNSRSSPAIMLIALVFLGSMAAAGTTIEIPLEHVVELEAQRYTPFSSLDVTYDQPEGNWTLPKLVSERPLYAFVVVRGKPHLVVFDQKDEDDPFNTVMYWDVEGDGDLSSAEALDADTRHFGDDYAFVHFAGDVPIPFMVTLQRSGDTIRAYTRLQIIFQGEVVLDDDSFFVLVSDSGGSGDPYYLNVRDTVEPNPGHWASMPRWVMMANRVFLPELDREVDRLLLTEQTEELATLRWNGDVTYLRLTAADEDIALLCRPGSSAHVPAGTYRLAHYDMEATDAQGDRWRISARGQEQMEPAVLEPGAEGVLRLGEPFAPVVNHRQFPDGIALDFAIRGAGAEQVVDLARIAGDQTEIPLAHEGRRPQAPSYRIVSADGEIVAQGNFEYG